jgi:DNA-binding NarL/FixJ family response regulator
MAQEGLTVEAAAAELRRVAGRAASGDGGVVLVTGEAGSGKTALVAAACGDAAAAGALVLWSSCEATDDAPGFWPWLQLLRQYMRQHAGKEFPAALQARMAEVIEMAPGVDAVIAGAAVPEALEVETARFRLFDAVTQVLRGAAGSSPLVVVLDDLQAADDQSLALLRHVAAELSGTRVVVLAVGRPVNARAASGLRETAAAIGRARGAERIDVASPSPRAAAGGLSAREREVAAMVADGLSNRDIAETLHLSERTAENHVQNILNKLGFSNRAQVAAWVARGEV